MVERVRSLPEIADALQNTHRARLAGLERELELQIEVISATNFRRTEERIDYQQREKAVVPKAEPALTSSDLASTDPSRLQTPQETEAAEKETEKRPRKRRRRRKSAAKPTPEADTKKTAEGKADIESESHTDSPASEAAAADNGKPSRPRRRRRGGRRNRKKPAADGDRAPATAEEATPVAPPHDDARDWNVGIVESDAPLAARGSEDGEAPRPKPRQRRRATTATKDNAKPPASKPHQRRQSTKANEVDDNKSGPGSRGSRSSAAGGEDEATTPKPRRRGKSQKPVQPVDDDAQPTSEDAWQSPLAAGQPAPNPPTHRSPLRRDRSTLRWQWWGGDSEEPVVPTKTESPHLAKNSEDP